MSLSANRIHFAGTCAIAVKFLVLLGVNDMTNRAISFESTEVGVAPEGWTATLTG
jgi:hypothetical protein